MSEIGPLTSCAVDLVTAQVDATTNWDAASPCEGWSALDVLAHVCGTVEKTARAVDGGEYTGAPSPSAGAATADAVLARWREASAATVRAVTALSAADLERRTDTPRGQATVRDALALPVADLATHAWDIAAAGGRELDLPPALRAHVEALVGSIPETVLREQFFGPEVTPPADASETERLMAFLGRRRPGQVRDAV